MKLRRVGSESLVETVVGRLRDYVQRAGLVAGDRMPTETELVNRLGISRSVLREAVGRLQTVGFLEVQHGRGTFVASASALINSAKLMQSAIAIAPRELMQFLEFRRLIESYAARRAAELATVQDLAGLEVLCGRIDTEGQSYLDSIRMDFQFHCRLVEIAGNEPMRNVFLVLQEFIMVGMVKTTPQPRDLKLSRRIHREVLKAIRSRDPQLASAAMDHHMELARLALQAAGDREP